MARGRPAKAERRVALISKRGRFLVGDLLFERGGGRISIGGGRRAAAPGRMALLELGPGRARVIRELGDPKVAADVIEALLLDRGVRRGFPGKLEGAATEAAEQAAAARVERRDLTDLATFTVDPATARDFDDAVSATESEGGIRLWVHIADVAAHIRPGGALEAEAHRRATSVYVPGTVEPMLPHALSSEACSLAPEQERLAVTTELQLSADGEVRSTRFYRSRVRSDARLYYDAIDVIFSRRAAPPE
ncbi:MAG: RNB domain-containing ribonuclease, partial [Solirubrobacterales bacterium]